MKSYHIGSFDEFPMHFEVSYFWLTRSNFIIKMIVTKWAHFDRTTTRLNISGTCLLLMLGVYCLCWENIEI